MSPERTPIAGLDDARSRDAADPLARFRDAFVIDDPTLVYLDGNSLGRLPKRARERVLDVMDGEWGQGLIRSWTHTPTGGSWFSAPERLGDAIGSLLGAAPGQVLVSDSTSVNLFKLAVAALQARPGKHKIVSDQLNFPSDLYVLEGATRLLGGDHRLELAPANAADDGPDLNALNDWFAHSVVGSDSTEGRLANTWYSVVNNIGLYLGEQIIAQTDSKIRWEMVKHRKNDVSYQRHVLRGFDVPNPTTRSTPIS